jgi:hypothetical protein
MSHSCAQNHIHLVFSTRNREKTLIRRRSCSSMTKLALSPSKASTSFYKKGFWRNKKRAPQGALILNLGMSPNFSASLFSEVQLRGAIVRLL